MSEWRTMETAPRDGEPILMYSDGGRFIVRWWTADVQGGWSLDLGGENECIVLREQDDMRWMPLPSAPV
jgi:hypothetical protein